ncbi:MAG: hypothetical protein IPO27_03865 [Bacteroidetes bacterium]|nr:hypothetical protein [Bacteroidota bacterium]
MRSTISATALCMLLTVTIYAQNLVLNPSFETLSPCPLGPGELINAQDWDDVNSGADSTSSPDLYAACSWQIGGVNSPNALLGYQPSRTGVAHAGIIPYEAIALFGCLSLGSSEYREYIRGTLLSTLQAGQSYEVSFYVSLANGAKFAVSDFGVYFSPTPIQQNFGTQPGVLQVAPQLTYTGGLLSDTAQWVKLQWNYVATGNENYFVIGNFKNDANTNWQCVNPNSFFPYCYYFIDDVSVQSLTSAAPLANLSSSDTVFCEKQSIDFFDLSTNSPTSWEWTFTGAAPASSTLQNPTGIYYPGYGSFDVQLIACNGAGCDTATFSQFITEYPNPPAPIISINGSQYCSTPAVSYSWYNTINLTQVLSTTQCFAPTVPGNYFVLISDSNGCSTPSSTVIFSSLENNITKNGIAAWVANDKILVTNTAGKIRIELYSIDAKLLYRSVENAGRFQLDKINYPVFLLISNEQGILYKQIMY